MLDLTTKNTGALLPTDILFQTPYWAQVKCRLGLEPKAFDIASAGEPGDVLVLLQPWGRRKVAVVPQGPEHAPAEEDYGRFIEEFSLSLAEFLGPRWPSSATTCPGNRRTPTRCRRGGGRPTPSRGCARCA